MSDAQPGREAATDNDGLRMVVYIALFTFGLMVLVAGIAIVSLLRKPAVAPMATPSRCAQRRWKRRRPRSQRLHPQTAS